MVVLAVLWSPLVDSTAGNDRNSFKSNQWLLSFNYTKASQIKLCVTLHVAFSFSLSPGKKELPCVLLDQSECAKMNGARGKTRHNETGCRQRSMLDIIVTLRRTYTLFLYMGEMLGMQVYLF